jgi:chromosome segregation ATPase
MSTPQEQAAAQLTDETASALVTAKIALTLAADAAQDVDAGLRRAEDEIGELAGQANRMYDSDVPDRQMMYAQEAAGEIGRRIGRGHEGLDEVRRQLGRASGALEAGRRSLGELEQVPGQQGEATTRLRRRLDSLSEVVEAAGRGTDRAGERLAETSRDLDRLRQSPERVQDREEAADAIRRAGRNVDEGVMDVRGGLRGLQQGLEDAGSEATTAARESVELATAARAGLNPTPASAQRVSQGAAEQDLRHRSAGPTQGADRDR